MTEDLYFLPIIARALQAADPASAMRAAFAQIEAIGQSPQYRRGYEQFAAFLQAAGDAGDEALVAAGARILAELRRPAGLQILVERDGASVGTCHLLPGEGPQTLTGLDAGHYCLRLDTGCLLWEGQLTSEELLWSQARRDRRVPLAADTGDAAPQPTRTGFLLDGFLVMRVYPGVEAGVMQLELRNVAEGP